MKTLRYLVIYLILLQLLLPRMVPLDLVYHNRIDYNIAKNNLKDIDTVLDRIKLYINKHDLEEYTVILGDSVLYGSPGDSDQAVNAFIQEKTGETVFNLAFPAMQLGDIYTMLLKLDKRGISTERLIFNVRYPSFTARNPDPPAVFWLKDDLRRLDSEVFAHVLPQLQINGYAPPGGKYQRLRFELKDHLNLFEPFAYKDYFKEGLLNLGRKAAGREIPSDALGDYRPWAEKEGFEEFVQSDTMKANYTDKPMDLTDKSYDVYFMNKIMEHQKNTKTMLVMTGSNYTLLKAYMDKPGYKSNAQALDRYLGSLPVQYVNLEGKIPDQLFTDHTHLTPEGYKAMADLLWQHYEQGGQP